MADISTLLRDKFVGPPSPKNYPPRPLEGRVEEEKDSAFQELLPLILAQVADSVTTESNIRKGAREVNPLPGMQSIVGRNTFGLVETLLAHFLTRNKPKLRNVLIPNMANEHFLAALENQKVADIMRRR